MCRKKMSNCAKYYEFHDELPVFDVDHNNRIEKDCSG